MNRIFLDTLFCLLSILTSLFSIINLSSACAEEEKTPLSQLLGIGEQLSLDGFIDTNLSVDFNKFSPRNRIYLTQPTRDREGQVNLAFIGAKLNTDYLRGRLTLQAGTSVDLNYAAESEQGWRYIQEAVVGAKLAEGLWIDGGIYLSHIGPESWISRDNWSYTRLLTSEFTPYYEKGMKLTYNPTSQWEVQLHYLNGWQNVSNFDAQSALGTAISYKLDSGWSIYYDNFIGNQPAGTRFFNEFIFKTPPLGPVELAAAINVGNQNQDDGGGATQWYSWSMLSRYSISDSIKLNARAEQYLDASNVIVSTPTEKPFKSIGFSLGIDIEVVKRLWWRTEYRAFISPDSIFATHEGEFKSTDNFVVTSLSLSI